MPRTQREVTSYTHPAPGPQQEPDQRPGFYYVSVRDGAWWAFACGPFTQHADALAVVDEVARRAIAHDPKHHFLAFGTMRLPPDMAAQAKRVDGHGVFADLLPAA